MDIAWGQTRFVILVARYAIKVGRIRPLRFLARLILMVFSLKRRQHFFEKYGDSFIHAVVHDIFAGIVSNRIEYLYCQKYDDARIMPVKKIFLRGLIIIQERGVPVSVAELAKESPVERPFFVRGKLHLSDPHQFCRNSLDKIVLVDYGNEATQTFLRKTA